ncbi:hypothetical protein C8R44DRAFT_947260 [Mycena epipterygia]|nr:hypothetical protein C8R44DRAFT_947260 [Mycena epipterygia]
MSFDREWMVWGGVLYVSYVKARLCPNSPGGIVGHSIEYKGGIADRPGYVPDVFHTIFGVAGTFYLDPHHDLGISGLGRDSDVNQMKMEPKKMTEGLKNKEVDLAGDGRRKVSKYQRPVLFSCVCSGLNPTNARPNQNCRWSTQNCAVRVNRRGVDYNMRQGVEQLASCSAPDPILLVTKHQRLKIRSIDLVHWQCEGAICSQLMERETEMAKKKQDLFWISERMREESTGKIIRRGTRCRTVSPTPTRGNTLHSTPI